MTHEEHAPGDNERPTMVELWKMLPEALHTAMIEAPGIPYIRVLYVFAGFPVTRSEVEAVLSAYNRLMQTHFTVQDIRDLHIKEESYVATQKTRVPERYPAGRYPPRHRAESLHPQLEQPSRGRCGSG